MNGLPPGRPARLTSVDTLRGIVMILMALDHVRDFFGPPGISPTNLAQTTVPLFLTRWVTHICAPTFFLLTGTGAFLALRSKSVAGLSRFLLTRGLWLIVLELTFIRCLGYQFNFDYDVTLLVVIWALGWAMVVLSALVWLPVPIVLAFGVALIAGHNLLDGVRSTNPLWVILHSQGFVVNRPGFVVFVAYPLIPWIGVTAVGYALGSVYRWDARRRQAILLKFGLALTAGFIVLRLINMYGDPAPWTHQATSALTVVSFLNVTKYPPSLLFLLMTLGPALLLLRALDRGTPPLLRPALVFGRVPLFYFVLHLTLIHLLAVILCYVQNGAVHWMFESPNLGAYPFTPPPGWGVSLPVTYLIWVLVVLMLYPVCAWFARVRERSTAWWLGYL
ncbi:MAG TPA: heparan-alpha-glucosaminide N-acetyltransferase domain-containing protein [Vicinamibacterales bacterium]|nr:heparan-alpha-glucosaminide N-acetyltransferase domain-containing protein [Vicinamibacterales bacterium]